MDVNLDKFKRDKNYWVCSKNNSSIESNSYNIAGRQGFELLTPQKLNTLKQQAVDRTLFLFDASPALAGTMPIVLGSGASGILLHEAIGHGMEADFNRRCSVPTA